MENKNNMIELQETSVETWENKYQLKDKNKNCIDKTIKDNYKRVAKTLAANEVNKEYWEDKFVYAMENGATPAGRILSNAGAEDYKPATSLINCTVSGIINDSMEGILENVKLSGLTLKAGCGIGYEFSTLRPSDSFVHGAGAETSGPLSFMEIFDKTCFTVRSAGGRRGAQMATFAVWHPDVEKFIKAKRADGTLRQFNMSLLIDDDFIDCVRNDLDWQLVFPIMKNEGKESANTVWKKRFWEIEYCKEQGYTMSEDNQRILCKVYSTIKATDLWKTIMQSTYDFSEPGFLLVDRINEYNNNYFCEEIRATNPCGEQPLPPYGSCLLGSVNVALFVVNPFTKDAYFDWEKYKEIVRIFTRMLDNVVEVNGLPLKEQQHELLYKRRHGMGVTGVGSAITLLGDTYGSETAVKFAGELMKVMAITGFEVGIDLAAEKGPAPIFNDFTNGESNKVLWINGKYMKKIWGAAPHLEAKALQYGCRFTHHTSIAPTGTISLSVNNNVSNGIEPSFSHKYTRNVIVTGKKSKRAVDVYSYEMLLYKHLTGDDDIPATFSTSDTVTTKQHVDMQSAAQEWCDSSISKTINVPSNLAFDDFKDIYLYAHEKGLKGCTTFRYNPEVFQGVLVKEDDLAATNYEFVLEDGTVVSTKGNDIIEYEGEQHTAANLYDAIKENYYGKF